MAYPLSSIAVRRLDARDLPAALAIQSVTYPAYLVEDADAFASRLGMAASYCLAAIHDGALIAYLLAHGWPSRAPPAIGTRLPADAVAEILFIHDLSVSVAGRGSGIGRRLVAQAFDMAARDGLRHAELIAVAGADRFWRGLGFETMAISADLAEKVAAYGPEARWMSRPIAD